MVGAGIHLAERRPSANPARNELDVGKVGVGALIDRLEASGFVLRQADPVDRRVKRVFVTKQARGFLEKLRKETDKFTPS